MPQTAVRPRRVPLVASIVGARVRRDMATAMSRTASSALPGFTPLLLVLSLLVLCCLAPWARAAGNKRAGGEEDTTASAIHICVDRSGAVSYQSAPCGTGQRTREVRTFRPTAVDPQLFGRTREIEREMDRRNHASRVSSASRGSAGRSRAAAPNPCQVAKDQRKRELARAGLKRNFDLLSRLDGAVWDACKGL